LPEPKEDLFGALLDADVLFADLVAAGEILTD
jgi:hypothetical protein